MNDICPGLIAIALIVVVAAAHENARRVRSRKRYNQQKARRNHESGRGD